MLEYNYYTGCPKDLLPNLKRSISQYANNASYIKIGITCNPRTRWNRHKKNDPRWSKMVIVYRSTSFKNTRLIEEELVNWTWEREESWNFIGGGGGNIGTGLQYVYFLIEY